MAQPRGIGTTGAGAPVLPHGRHGLSPIGRVKAARLAARSAQFMTPLQDRRQAPTTASAFAQALRHRLSVPAPLLPVEGRRAATTLHESLLRRYTPTLSNSWYRSPAAASSTHLYTLLASWYGHSRARHSAQGGGEGYDVEPWAASVPAIAADEEAEGAMGAAGIREEEGRAVPASSLERWPAPAAQTERMGGLAPLPPAVVPAALNPVAAARTADALVLNQGAQFDVASRHPRPQAIGGVPFGVRTRTALSPRPRPR